MNGSEHKKTKPIQQFTHNQSEKAHDLDRIGYRMAFQNLPTAEVTNQLRVSKTTANNQLRPEKNSTRDTIIKAAKPGVITIV